MSSTAMHEAEQEVKDLRAELMRLERKLQEGANRRSRVLNAGRQEDLESRIRTEAQEVEALEDKLKAIDTEVQDAQDQLRDAEVDLEGLMEERHATVSAMKRIKVRQVKANEELAHYEDMCDVIAAVARHHKVRHRARRVGGEDLLDRLGPCVQEEGGKETATEGCGSSTAKGPTRRIARNCRVLQCRTAHSFRRTKPSKRVHKEERTIARRA